MRALKTSGVVIGAVVLSALLWLAFLVLLASMLFGGGLGVPN